jgi:acyl carrier protein
MHNTLVVNPCAPSRSQIEHAVILSVSRTLRLPPEQVTLNRRLYEDLGLDSMGLIQVNVYVEEQLKVALDIAEAPENDLESVQDLVEFIEQRIRSANQELTC